MSEPQIERHEFVISVLPNVCNLAFCGQPREADCHVVESYPNHAFVPGWAASCCGFDEGGGPCGLAEREHAVCVEGEPMMHGSRPYRWCETHKRFWFVCQEPEKYTATARAQPTQPHAEESVSQMMAEEEAQMVKTEERVQKYMEGYIKGQSDRAKDWCPMIEQFCKDLNSAHNEILRAQGVAESDFEKFDWPEWTPQANSIRWAENLLKKKLAKTDHWTLYPSKENR